MDYTNMELTAIQVLFSLYEILKILKRFWPAGCTRILGVSNPSKFSYADIILYVKYFKLEMKLLMEMLLPNLYELIRFSFL